ncbi:hypothetical protein Desku_2815 [Desulfofundulus kuznetsovii DSM 6115]|uniref:Uncharacterized protein n=1 Tax=Desulfofundulus kuznetsovii (strain DSM 6115 / VKM B-1805 / 17) TaxID=760568 RepID=A0AAU8PJT8_DESK7|nr:hypothetical protein Desku_2815 [Desulfofundulus kuznetsovii DSM 6115]
MDIKKTYKHLATCLLLGAAGCGPKAGPGQAPQAQQEQEGQQPWPEKVAYGGRKFAVRPAYFKINYLTQRGFHLFDSRSFPAAIYL